MAITDQPDFEPISQRKPGARSSGACSADRGVCRIHGTQFVSMQAAHASELSALRRRIETLETALAQAEAARAAAVTVSDHPPVTSIQIHDTDRRKTDQPADPDLYAELSANVSNITTGAAAWDDDDATFSERIAALAFFGGDDGDQPARRWLLRNS